MRLVILILIGLVSSPVIAQQWPGPLGPGDRVQVGNGNLSEARVNWTFATGDRVRGGPAIGDLDGTGDLFMGAWSRAS